jgi:hypothetical protein
VSFFEHSFLMFVLSLSWQMFSTQYKTAQRNVSAPSRCNKTVFFRVFPMFVPGLSWQNDAFSI